jgi:hypothetical protein
MELQICGCRAMWNVSGTNENNSFVEAGLGVILSNMENLDLRKFKSKPCCSRQSRCCGANLQKIVEVGTMDGSSRP